MNVTPHEISFSFNQPETILNPLRMVMQHMLSQPNLQTAKIMPLLNARMILIIDAQRERADYIARLLMSVGYRPSAAATNLDAFTLFLQGTCIPFAIVLGQEESSGRFFLIRLLQQMKQKYEWEVPIIRLNTRLSQEAPRHTTAPLMLPPPSSRKTTSALLPHAQPADNPSPSRPLPILPQATLPQAPIPTQASPVQLPEHTTNIEKKAEEKISLKGQNIGRYQILASLNDTSHCDVYSTYDRLREYHIALKAIQTQTASAHTVDLTEEEGNIFQREKEIIAALNHPHILPILNCGKSYISGTPFAYKTMPYCTEGSLAQWLAQHPTKTFPPREVLPFISQIGEALQVAHDHRILYQNFKFSNILIREPAKELHRLHVLLTDFSVLPPEYVASKAVDTFPYMAPERWSGQSLPASDQYGLAAMVYELLTGRILFQGQSEQIVKHMHLNMQPQPPSMFNSAIAPAIDGVLLRALAKKPEDRFGSLMLFVKTFQQCCR